jgi:hypothetical protein
VSHAGGRSTSDDREDGTRKLTGEQRQQRQLTNRSNKDDISIEGDVAEIHLDESPPYILIGSEDGLVKVVLLCRDGCATTRVDDYVQADGEQQHELLFHADSLEVRRRR